MAKILIAGGAGYVGSRLCPLLQAIGHEVDVVDLGWFGYHIPKSCGLNTGNLFNITADALQGYDQVMFLAGLSNDPMADFAPGQNFIYNAAGPAYLAYAAKKAGVERFIYASSCSVYGFEENGVSTEESPTTCGYPYGLSKLQGERAVMQLADKNFSVIALRKGTISGFSPRMRFDLILNKMYRDAIRNGVIVVNNPSIWRPILAIKDALTAYTCAVDSKLSGVFNIASGNFTVGQLADFVRDFCDSSVRVHTLHKQDVRNYRVSCAKARTLLGFQARESINDILRDIVSNDALALDSEECYNIDTLRSKIEL